MNPLFFFDLLGTFAFSAYGAYLGQRKGFDIFGVLVCACVSAFGGGTIRELLLNRLPVYFQDPRYLLLVILGIVFNILLFTHFPRIQRFMLSLDAIGLVTFAYLGATSALTADLGVIGVLIFATVSAVGGGVLCDLLIREIPRIFYRDFYATPALLVGLGVFLLQKQLSIPVVGYALLFVVFCIRLLAIKYRIELWKPVEHSSEGSM